MKQPYTPEILEPFAYGYISELENGPYIAMGEALYREGEVFPIVYDPEVGLFQCDRLGEGAGFRSNYGIYYSKEVFAEKRAKFPEYAAFFEEVEHVVGSRNTAWLLDAEFTPTERKCFQNNTMWGGTWAGHTVPDYGGLLSLGTAGLRAKITKYRAVNPHAEDFYNGLERILDLFETVGKRVQAEALAMAAAEQDPALKAHLEAIARSMENCPQNPPRDFLEAAQMFWLFFSYDGYDSPGRLDQIFLPYWQKTPREEALQILDGMWVGFHKNRSWNVCISGSHADGTDSTNEISFAMLDLVQKYRFNTPNLTMRCHENTDPALIRRAAEVLGEGCGLPALYNDRAVCRMFTEELGIPAEDAHNYAMNGCNQIDIQGKSHMGLEDGEVNLYKCLEYALTRGKCLITGEVLAPDTGDPAEFASFEDVMQAFRTQVEYVTDMACRTSNKCQKVHADHAPNLWRSIMIQGCIEKGRDFKAGGPIYNHGQILAEGIADTVDSLAAIRYHVFEKKNFTLPQIIAAMERDFAGDEPMRQMLSEKPVRFGNGCPETDSLAGEILEHYFRYLLTIPTYRGGWYTGGCSPFNRSANYGRKVGAGANGRHCSYPIIADSIGAVPGRDEKGPTALLDSVLHLPHHLAGSGFILNIKFDKSLFATEEGIRKFIALWQTFFAQGGQQLSVSVVSAEELADAKIHPENHRNLIVRVGGYSDYFVDLSAELQDNIIARTMNR